MSVFYSIISSKVSHGEYWWGTRSPAVLIGWVLKWLRVPIPSSSDDPNTDSTLPFVVDSLPDDIAAKFQPLMAELSGLGFKEPIFHRIYDPGTETTIHWATFSHVSGNFFARVHHRVWQKAKPSERALFPMFFTEFSDGTFIVSSSGKPDMLAEIAGWTSSFAWRRLRGCSLYRSPGLARRLCTWPFFWRLVCL